MHDELLQIRQVPGLRSIVKYVVAEIFTTRLHGNSRKINHKEFIYGI